MDAFYYVASADEFANAARAAQQGKLRSMNGNHPMFLASNHTAEFRKDGPRHDSARVFFNLNEGGGLAFMAPEGGGAIYEIMQGSARDMTTCEDVFQWWGGGFTRPDLRNRRQKTMDCLKRTRKSMVDKWHELQAARRARSKARREQRQVDDVNEVQLDRIRNGVSYDAVFSEEVNF